MKLTEKTQWTGTSPRQCLGYVRLNFQYAASQTTARARNTTWCTLTFEWNGVLHRNVHYFSKPRAVHCPVGSHCGEGDTEGKMADKCDVTGCRLAERNKSACGQTAHTLTQVACVRPLYVGKSSPSAIDSRPSATATSPPTLNKTPPRSVRLLRLANGRQDRSMSNGETTFEMLSHGNVKNRRWNSTTGAKERGQMDWLMPYGSFFYLILGCLIKRKLVTP